MNVDTTYQDKITFLEKELEKETALRVLVETVRAIFPFDFVTTRIRSKEIKQKLVAAIQTAAKLHQLKTCLQCIKVTPRVYYRWVSDDKICALTKGLRKHPNQLTNLEI